MDDNGIPDGWHRFPKDDAWKKCTLRGLVENGERLWLYCAGCRRTRYLETVQWAETHGVNLDWPLLTLARRMRCNPEEGPAIKRALAGALTGAA